MSTRILKAISIVPSAGENLPNNPIPIELENYCTALEDAAPTQGFYTSGEPHLDTIQLHFIALTKDMHVDQNNYDLEVTWTPTRFAHEVDTQDPWNWTYGASERGLVYPVTMLSGARMFLGIRFAP